MNQSTILGNNMKKNSFDSCQFPSVILFSTRPVMGAEEEETKRCGAAAGRTYGTADTYISIYGASDSLHDGKRLLLRSLSHLFVVFNVSDCSGLLC